MGGRSLTQPAWPGCWGCADKCRALQAAGTGFPNLAYGYFQGPPPVDSGPWLESLLRCFRENGRRNNVCVVKEMRKKSDRILMTPMTSWPNFQGLEIFDNRLYLRCILGPTGKDHRSVAEFHP